MCERSSAGLPPHSQLPVRACGSSASRAPISTPLAATFCPEHPHYRHRRAPVLSTTPASLSTAQRPSRSPSTASAVGTTPLRLTSPDRDANGTSESPPQRSEPLPPTLHLPPRHLCPSDPLLFASVRAPPVEHPSSRAAPHSHGTLRQRLPFRRANRSPPSTSVAVTPPREMHPSLLSPHQRLFLVTDRVLPISVRLHRLR